MGFRFGFVAVRGSDSGAGMTVARLPRIPRGGCVLRNTSVSEQAR